ncbi:MAG: MBL fold metallo-hydrolase [Rhodanobacter sp.]|nr:MAG: MBL fold metallo-hydrolase [Rhodanobacter sp.]
MFFSTRPRPDGTVSYFFGCSGKGKAIAVDVVKGDETWFLEEARQREVSITCVVDTHLHADHYTGGPTLAALSSAEYAIHASSPIEFAARRLRDGEVLEIGNVTAQVLHTPGHTLDSICLLVSDRRRSAEPWFVITGDTLFVGAVGRPDLAGREREMAGMLFDSLRQKLLSLPAHLEIHPGHMAGSVCGAGLSGKPVSTLGFECRFSPALVKATAGDREGFVELVTEELPPQPAEMARIVDANKRAA